MAVQNQTPYIEYTANGSTTSFALGFDCESQNNLIVLVDDSEPEYGSWYLNNGTVVFHTAPKSNQKLVIKRETPLKRETNFQSYDNSFRPKPVNDDFDRIWWKLQELGVADWILNNRIDALKNYVDKKDDELKAYLLKEIRKQGVALDQLENYYNYLMEQLAQVAANKGWLDSFVVTWSGKTQEEENKAFTTNVNYLADLDKIAKFTGRRVTVLNYSSAVKSEVLTYVYDASRATENNGGTAYNGWIAQLKDYVTPEMFGATSTADTAFTLLFAFLNKDKTIKRVRLDNYYYLTQEFSLNRGDITFYGDGSVDISKSPTTGGKFIFNFIGGGKGAKTTITSGNIAFGAMSFTVADASSLAVGDWIGITSNGEYWNGIEGVGGYSVYYKGELNKIKGINGNTITLLMPLQDSYLTSTHTVNITKINMIENIAFKDGLKFYGHGLNNYSGATNVSGFTKLIRKECVVNFFFKDCSVNNFVTQQIIYGNIGFNHTYINPTAENNIAFTSTETNSPSKMGILASDYGVSNQNYINCNSTGLRRLMNPDQSAYGWVDSSNPKESIHSKGITVLGGRSFNCFNAIGGHQYYDLKVLGHTIIGGQGTGIQHRGKKLTVSGTTIEGVTNGIVLGIGTTTSITTYTEDPTCGDVVIDSSVSINAATHGIWATESFDSFVCHAKITSPISILMQGKRQSNMTVTPNFVGDGTGNAIIFSEYSGVTSRERCYFTGGSIRGFKDSFIIYGKSGNIPSRDIRMKQINFRDISNSYLNLPSIDGYSSSIRIQGCSDQSVSTLTPLINNSETDVRNLDNTWTTSYPMLLSVVNNTLTISAQQDGVYRVYASNTTTAPTLTSISGGLEGQRIILVCYSPLTGLTLNSSTTGLALKTDSLTLARNGYIELIKTGSNTWSELARSSLM